MDNINQFENTLSKILTNPSMKIKEILERNPDRCFISLLGEIINENTKEPEIFVLKIKKKEFDIEIGHISSENISEKIKQIISTPNQLFNNDIYYKLLATDLIDNKVIFINQLFYRLK
jgi:hypothetical protein